ncbi:MAG: SEC-C metal-binding domain-containing protein, partial [Clostridium sp.]
MNLNRNDECWCGSNKKYKKCHMDFDQKLHSLQLKGHVVPQRELIKNKEQIEGIKASAKINNKALDLVAEQIKV